RFDSSFTPSCCCVSLIVANHHIKSSKILYHTHQYKTKKEEPKMDSSFVSVNNFEQLKLFYDYLACSVASVAAA
ncbi:hypothetical protein, partial [Moraxella catarrhalis]|uniref:hypothetical protein n=1 Tax=Moraxella catarrhalis TaxID=480 RepID=UPI0019D40F34